MTPVRGLPRRVWIGSYEFPLTLVPRDHPELTSDGTDDDPDADGCTLFEHPGRAILLADDLGPRELFDTVLHELTHAVNFVGDLPDTSTDEEICTAHGKVWSQLWLDNPRLQAWFTRVLNQLRRDMKEG